MYIQSVYSRKALQQKLYSWCSKLQLATWKDSKQRPKIKYTVADNPIII